MRTLITQDPYFAVNQGKKWNERGLWPCSWIVCPGAGQPPFVTAYRLQFSLDQPERIRIHVAADERYDLYLDGIRIGRGNERGAPDTWFFETYDLPMQSGNHCLVARVWSLGDRAAEAQMSVHPGFLLAAEGKWTSVLGSGLANWEAKLLTGYTFLSPNPAHWRGDRIRLDGKAFPWEFELGNGDGWAPVRVLKPGMGRLINWEFYREHLLRPATLPPLINQEIKGIQVRFIGQVGSPETQTVPVRMQDHHPEEAGTWKALINSAGTLTVPENSQVRVLLDLDNYYCFYPEITLSGGAGSLVRCHSAESLYHSVQPLTNKGNRDEIEGKFFVGFGDEFLPDGGSHQLFDSLWWQSGRYVELFIQTADQPLTFERLVLRETRYPLEMESEFNSADPRLTQVMPLLIRGMQICSNETYFDCPYYEELQYAGDTRLEILTTYIMTRDDRLPRKAMRMFDASRLASGLTQSRYPSRVTQIIPPFALWWIMMVRDYAYWRDDLAFVRQLMPGVRATLDGFQRFMGQDGLLYGPEGWNVMDWVPAWSEDAGVPPDGHTGASGLFNWQLIYALAQAADLEEQLGETPQAAIFRQRAQDLALCAQTAFWDAQRGLMADDVSHRHFSEHTQCMALLSQSLLAGALPPAVRARLASGLISDPHIERTTIYFSHYLFETYRLLGQVDKLLERMPLWFDLVQQGLKTPVEMPEPTRSDCHAWGSHPLYHYFTTILGIRPVGLGFQKVEIIPQLGMLPSASGKLVHPAGGRIEVEFSQTNGRVTGRVHLPQGVSGQILCNRERLDLQPGETRICP